MPYNSYKKHYTDYRRLRLSSKPKRNFHNVAYEPITGADLEFEFLQVDDDDEIIDQELTQYRWEVAKTKASIAYLEQQKKLYSKLVRFPIATDEMSLTKFYERKSTESITTNYFSGEQNYRKASWSERRQSAIDSWEAWKNEEIGPLRDWNGYKNSCNIRKKSHKEIVEKEFEYMTTGDGFNYYLNGLTIAENLKIHEAVLGEAKTLAVFIAENEKKVHAQRKSLYHDITKLASGVKNAKNDLRWRSSTESPYYGGDATKLISSMRSINKQIKDLKQDSIYFKEAFASEWGDNTVLVAFGNDVSEISKKNPYLEKRILWESLMQPRTAKYNEISSKLDELNQYLESLGTEEQLEAKREERDKLFRQRHERKLEIERNVEDRKQSITDHSELQTAKAKIALILETRKNHGHLSSKGKEKMLYLSCEEAYDDMVKLYKKDKRKLQPYSQTISVKYSQWCITSRRRMWQYHEIDGWFLRTFEE